jgi:hypothetical protein
MLRPCLFSSLLVFSALGCATMSSEASKRGLLRLEVTPAEAEVFIDDAYQGRIAGWHERTLPVRSGERRVALSAPGHLTQRFDLTVAPGEEVTLKVQLIPLPAAPPEDAPESDKEQAP